MHVERLTRIADLAENLPFARALNPSMPTSFHLGKWGCGSVACLVGHAVYDRWFNEQGLTLAMTGTLSPQYAGVQGWPAVCVFFGLTDDEARHLFAAASYDDPTDAKSVASRIREFVPEREAVPA